jgi:pyruvate dehydrogenase (quinone)
VISLSGDGGFNMLMDDFLSLTQLKLPVKVVVFNNGRLSFVELEQMSTGSLTTGIDLMNLILRRWRSQPAYAASGSKSWRGR